MLVPLVREEVAGVTANEQKALDWLWEMPLSSAVDLGYMEGAGWSFWYRVLRNLQQRGLVDGMRVGWSRRAQERYWLTDEALGYYYMRGRGVNCRTGLASLVDNFSLVEWTYYLVGEISGRESAGGRLQFSWVQGYPFEAAARFDNGWAAFAWSGMWENRERLERRLRHLPDAMKGGRSAESVGLQPWPGLFVFVVADNWQAQQVWELASLYGLRDRLLVCDVDKGSLIGTRDLARSGAWIDDGWYDSEVVEDYDVSEEMEVRGYADRNCTVMSKVMYQVEQWSGSLRYWLSGLTRESRSRVNVALERLEGLGLVQARNDVFFATEKAAVYAATRDGVPLTRVKGRLYLDKEQERFEDHWKSHEHGLIRLASGFRRAGVGTAVGWRGDEHLGVQGMLAPDAMVFLEEGGYGRGWYYVEYERTARGEARVTRKLRAYLTGNRRNGWPVLVVCRDEVAEKNFWKVGSGLDMLTTTVARVKRGSGHGQEGVWQRFGESVVIY